MRYAKGIMWLDDCRIPFVDEGDKGSAKPIGKITSGSKENVWFNYTDDKVRIELPDKQSPLGRFTPNLLVCDDMLNDGSVSNSTGGIPNGKSVYGRTSYNESSTINTQTKVGFGDKGTNSRYYDLDKWFDKVIDEIR